LIPLMIGAKDLAFPRINLLSWYIYMIGGCFIPLRALLGRRGYRLDFLHALSALRTQTDM
jgi:cytochrome c oxidase subunit 1